MYRKFSPQFIFNGKEFLNSTHSLITTEDGVVIDIVNDTDGGEIMPGIITPGFINCHCHLELSHLKGKIEKNTGLVNFVQEVMKIREEPADIKSKAIELALEEIYNSGTVAVGDICNTADTIPFKTKNIHWKNFIEVSGFVDSTAKQRFNAAEEILNLFNEGLLT
ncbi:MAG: amidohydrolase family protein, partial [Ferruginibacter sp.]